MGLGPTSPHSLFLHPPDCRTDSLSSHYPGSFFGHAKIFTYIIPSGMEGVNRRRCQMKFNRRLTRIFHRKGAKNAKKDQGKEPRILSSATTGDTRSGESGPRPSPRTAQPRIARITRKEDIRRLRRFTQMEKSVIIRVNPWLENPVSGHWPLRVIRVYPVLTRIQLRKILEIRPDPVLLQPPTPVNKISITPPDFIAFKLHPKRPGHDAVVSQPLLHCKT